VQEALRSLLLTALGSLVGSRVTWGERPQASSLPAVVLTTISEDPAYVYNGPIDLESYRVQVDIYSSSASASLAIDRLLKSAVSGFKGIVGSVELTILLEARRFDSVEDALGSTSRIHRISRDLRVVSQET
jgi:hypothetical protein